jgi:hypothetical protein
MRTLHCIALGISLLLTAGNVADAQLRVSGVVTSVASNGESFTLDELGAAGMLVRRTILLAPDVRIVEVSRHGDASGAAEPGAWPGGFRETPFEASDVRPGDFVTVVAGGQGTRVQARSVEVIRGTDGAASPATEFPSRRR